MRRALLVAMAVTGLLGPATAAHAVQTGIADQQRALFAHPAFAELGVQRARYVLPWDAPLTGDAAAAAWLDEALARGVTPVVALDHGREMRCPGEPCAGPAPEQLEAAVRALRERWPAITEITPWNEPNHRSQPTWQRPELAAAYYGAARRACPGCTLVAGDLLDDSGLRRWLAAYRTALPEEPAVWGLHNYFDATYFSSGGVDTILAETPGEVWLTETGGIVRHTTPSGELPYDEHRAADAIRWLYAMTASRPRVTRMYLYQWQSSHGAHFDAGLFGLDGSERPGMRVVREQLAVAPPGGAPAAAAPAAQGIGTGIRASAPPLTRIAGRAIRYDARRGRLVIRLSCLSGRASCRGRVSVIVSASKRRPRISSAFAVGRGKTKSIVLKLSPAARRAVAKRTKLQLRIRTGGEPAQRVRVRVARRPLRS